MGACNIYLVPSAILYNGRGLTKEELTRQLEDFTISQTNRLNGRYFVPGQKVDTPLMDHWCFFGGLHRTAEEILNLGFSKQFHDFHARNISKGKYVQEPHLMIGSFLEDKTIKSSFEVSYFKGHTLSPSSDQYKISSHEEPKEGKISSCSVIGDFGDEEKDLYIKNILKKKTVFKKISDEDIPGSIRAVRKIKEHICTVEANEVKYIRDKRTFFSLDDLIEAEPSFNPEFMYDFSQKNGKLNPQEGYGWFHGNQTDVYRWIQKDGLYYFDLANLLESTYAFDDYDGYTSLILSAESLKKGNTSFFRYNARRARKIPFEFLGEHNDSREKYERAVWDVWTSQHANEHNLTNTELMNMRLQMNARFSEAWTPQIRLAMNEEEQRRFAAHDKRLAEYKKEHKGKEDIPF